MSGTCQGPGSQDLLFKVVCFSLALVCLVCSRITQTLSYCFCFKSHVIEYYVHGSLINVPVLISSEEYVFSHKVLPAIRSVFGSVCPELCRLQCQPCLWSLCVPDCCSSTKLSCKAVLCSSQHEIQHVDASGADYSERIYNSRYVCL